MSASLDRGRKFEIIVRFSFSQNPNLRTTLIGNPELRFQPNEGVQKSIINNIRYTADRGTKEAYQNVLGKNIFMHT